MRCPNCGCWHTQAMGEPETPWAHCRKPEHAGPRDGDPYRCPDPNCRCHTEHMEWHAEQWGYELEGAS